MVKIRKEVVLEARDVSMTFNQGTEREVNVFRGINFELHAGEILAIIGPKRMDYAKNKSLIEYMKKLLNASNANMIVLVTSSGFISVIQ